MSSKLTYEELEQRVRDLEKVIVERRWPQDVLRESDRELNIRNQITQIFLTTSDDALYGEVLQVVLEAMESEYGTFAYINENGDRVVPSMTRGIWDECKIREKDIRFPRETWGNNLWARCLIEKRAICSNGPFKVPDGHIPITRALALPIIHQGQAIGNFMVGNKATDYDQKDEELLKTIAEHTAPILNAWLKRAIHEKERRRTEEEIRSLAKFPSENPNPVIRVAKDGTVLYANEASLPLLDVWGCQVSQCVPDEWYRIIFDVFVCGTIKATEIQCGDRTFSLKIAPIVEADYVNIYGLDITEPKRAEETLRRTDRALRVRNRISEIFLTIPDEQMYAEVLQVILEALQSKYGIFGYMDELGCLVIPSMTRDIWERCQVPDKTTVYPPETWGGIWGQSLTEKRSLYANEGLQVPEGHLPIISVLVAPIKYGGDVIGLLEVANKATGYDEKDKAFLETIADHIAPVLNARLQRDRQQKERNEAQQALRKAHNNLERRVEERTAELRRLSSQLLEVEENTRRRIARDLHDSIGQSLTAIKFGLENALTRSSQDIAKESAELLETLIPLIQQASKEVRQIHTDLRPSLLDDLGIMSTISWFCRELEKVYSGIKIEKQMDMEEKDVPEPLKIVIFRVLQEALNNVVKHSKAALVRVSVKARNGKLELVVGDNGQGFDVERVSLVRSSEKGFGLTSMKERTELSGGAFAIESTPGVGTVVRASWPI
jgi:signal transduction histidine kinase